MAADTALLDDITNAVRPSFDECRTQVGASQILGYAICTDDTAITCSPIVASRRGLALYSLGNPDDFRFNPEQWDVQQEVDELRTVNNAIYSLYAQSEDYENNDNWHQEYRTSIFELFVQALLRLDANEYFGIGRIRDETFLMAWVVDSKTSKEQGRDWSQRLNRPAMHGAFVNWLAKTEYWG